MQRATSRTLPTATLQPAGQSLAASSARLRGCSVDHLNFAAHLMEIDKGLLLALLLGERWWTSVARPGYGALHLLPDFLTSDLKPVAFEESSRDLVANHSMFSWHGNRVTRWALAHYQG